MSFDPFVNGLVEDEILAKPKIKSAKDVFIEMQDKVEIKRPTIRLYISTPENFKKTKILRTIVKEMLPIYDIHEIVIVNNKLTKTINSIRTMAIDFGIMVTELDQSLVEINENLTLQEQYDKYNIDIIRYVNYSLIFVNQSSLDLNTVNIIKNNRFNGKIYRIVKYK